jgi:hypothetical protein
MPERSPAGEDNTKLTRAGCVVTFLTVVVIFGVAIPIVQWRDADTGQPLPRTVAIVAPFLIGALFYGVCSLLLWLVRLGVWSKEDGEPPAE